jgi:hypothetical protein
MFKVMVLFLSYRCINRTINFLKESMVIFRGSIKTRKCVNANNIEILRVSVCLCVISREKNATNISAINFTPHKLANMILVERH